MVIKGLPIHHLQIWILLGQFVHYRFFLCRICNELFHSVCTPFRFFFYNGPELFLQSWTLILILRKPLEPSETQKWAPYSVQKHPTPKIHVFSCNSGKKTILSIIQTGFELHRSVIPHFDHNFGALFLVLKKNLCRAKFGLQGQKRPFSPTELRVQNKNVLHPPKF